MPHCRTEIQRIYQRLDIHFDHEYGESFYHGQLAEVVQDFQQQGLAQESDGAICVFLDGFETPMIIRKKDGAFLYATTDLATLRYRVETWHPDAILYVGTGEGLHRPDLSVGDGIFKSTDGGKTWAHVGLADVQQIQDRNKVCESLPTLPRETPGRI